MLHVFHLIDRPGSAALRLRLHMRPARKACQAQEPSHRSGLCASMQVQAFSKRWSQRIGFAP